MARCSCPLTFFSTGAPVPFGTNHCPLSTPASSPPTLLSQVFEENKKRLSLFFFLLLLQPTSPSIEFSLLFRFVTLISPSFWQEVYTCQHIHFSTKIFAAWSAVRHYAFHNLQQSPLQKDLQGIEHHLPKHTLACYQLIDEFSPTLNYTCESSS